MEHTPMKHKRRRIEGVLKCKELLHPVIALPDVVRAIPLPDKHRGEVCDTVPPAAFGGFGLPGGGVGDPGGFGSGGAGGPGAGVPMGGAVAAGDGPLGGHGGVALDGGLGGHGIVGGIGQGGVWEPPEAEDPSVEKFAKMRELMASVKQGRKAAGQTDVLLSALGHVRHDPVCSEPEVAGDLEGCDSSGLVDEELEAWCISEHVPSGRKILPPDEDGLVPPKKEGGEALWTLSPVIRRSLWRDSRDVMRNHWLQQAERIASQHVESAFEELYEHYNLSTTAEDVSATMVLAGVNPGDHEATVACAQRMFCMRLPDVCTARLNPDNLRSFASATHSLTEQLLRKSTWPICHNDNDDNATDEESDEEEDEMRTSRMGIMDFADWYHDQKRSGGVILFVERADTVRKDILRDLIGSWTAVCLDDAPNRRIPLFIVLGLQQPVSEGYGMFEGQPVVNLRFNDSLQLFDASAITSKFLKTLCTETSSPFALSPPLLKWLQSNLEYKSRSVAESLRILAHICHHRVAVAPVLDLPRQQSEALRREGCYEMHNVAAIFRLQLQDDTNVEKLRAVWQDWASPRCLSEVRNEAANAFAGVTIWRQQLCGFLEVWNAFHYAVEPLSRGHSEIDRYCSLLEKLWPVDVGHGDEAEMAEAEQKREVDFWLGDQISRLNPDDDACIASADLDKLWSELTRASHLWPADLREKLLLCGDQEGTCHGGRLEDWFLHVRNQCWQPLTGAARAIFLSIFNIEDFSNIIDESLNGFKPSQRSFMMETLSLLSATSGERRCEMSILYRLLESHGNRSVESSELWTEFSRLLGDDHLPSAKLKQRFGHAALGLCGLGLFEPVARTHAPKTNRAMDLWRMRKRHFGRAWACPAATLHVPAVTHHDAASAAETWSAGFTDTKTCSTVEAAPTRVPMFQRAALAKRRHQDMGCRPAQEPCNKKRTNEGKLRIFMA